MYIAVIRLFLPKVLSTWTVDEQSLPKLTQANKTEGLFLFEYY